MPITCLRKVASIACHSRLRVSIGSFCMWCSGIARTLSKQIGAHDDDKRRHDQEIRKGGMGCHTTSAFLIAEVDGLRSRHPSDLRDLGQTEHAIAWFEAGEWSETAGAAVHDIGDQLARFAPAKAVFRWQPLAKKRD